MTVSMNNFRVDQATTYNSTALPAPSSRDLACAEVYATHSTTSGDRWGIVACLADTRWVYATYEDERWHLYIDDNPYDALRHISQQTRYALRPVDLHNWHHATCEIVEHAEEETRRLQKRIADLEEGVTIPITPLANVPASCITITTAGTADEATPTVEDAKAARTIAVGATRLGYPLHVATITTVSYRWWAIVERQPYTVKDVMAAVFTEGFPARWRVVAARDAFAVVRRIGMDLLSLRPMDPPAWNHILCHAVISASRQMDAPLASEEASHGVA